PRMVGAAGRRGALLASVAVMAIAALMLSAVPGFAGILVFIGVCALFGAVLANTATAVLSDRHGPGGARVITEANAVAAWIGLFAPAVLGVMAGLSWGWRPAAIVIALVAGSMFLVARRTSSADVGAVHPERVVRHTSGESARVRMPTAFYWCLVGVAAAVATEFSINFWGALLVAQRTGADLATATVFMSVPIAGVALGRTLGAPLVARVSANRLVVGAFLLAGVGLAVIVAAPVLELSVAGLLVAGLGISLLFPLTQSLAISNSGGRSVRAVALVAVAIGVSMGAAPFALGALSSAIGIVPAFGLVPAVILAGIVSVWVRTRRA
ncbi:MAG: hypothetical protein U0904_01000, partial [Candidatus Nanopelagicales bacterium]|nr:hypothetical protein [Candidatus Nanopelagicales bacterium]